MHFSLCTGSLYPVDSASLYRWVLILLLFYMAVSYLFRDTRGERYIDGGHEFMLTQLFNGITFAGSATILWGVVDPTVMVIIGDTTMFLLVAGMAGLLYSARQLVKTRRER